MLGLGWAGEGGLSGTLGSVTSLWMYITLMSFPCGHFSLPPAFPEEERHPLPGEDGQEGFRTGTSRQPPQAPVRSPLARFSLKPHGLGGALEVPTPSSFYPVLTLFIFLASLPTSFPKTMP